MCPSANTVCTSAFFVNADKEKGGVGALGGPYHGRALEVTEWGKSVARLRALPSEGKINKQKKSPKRSFISVTRRVDVRGVPAPVLRIWWRWGCFGVDRGIV